MPFYSTKSKLKRKLIAKENNQPLNIGGKTFEKQNIDKETYRQPALIDNVQVSDYPRRFRSANVTLPLELNSVSIVQNVFNVSIDEENSNYNIYPNESFQQFVDDGDISIKWFMDSVEVVGETNVNLALDENNADQGKTVYAEVTNNVDASIVTSNTITIAKVAWTPQQLTSLTLWLDASDESTITKDVDNNISIWNDKSGNNKNATPPTTSASPNYLSNEVAFDGVDDHLYFSKGLNIEEFFNKTVSFFLVLTINNVNSKSAGVIGTYSSNASSNSTPNPNQFWNLFVTPNNQLDFKIRINDDEELVSTVSSNFGLGDVKIVHFSYTNKKLSLQIDFGLPSEVLLSKEGYTANDLPVGIGNTLSRFYPFSLYSVLALESSISSNEKEKMEGYLAHKWNLTDKLPTNHPYKTTAP